MKKILIIDADVELLQTLSNELSQAGYQVDTATTAQDGLAKAPYASLIILAVELPDQNGFVTCSNLKRNEQTKYIPVFITSSAETTTAFEQHLALPIHADGYFLKPLDMAVMLEEISNIFAELDAAASQYYQVEENVAPAQSSDDEMIDVGTKGDDYAADDDSEVIKALSLEDINLFADIDAGSLEDPEDSIFDNETQPPAATQAPESAPAPAPAPAPANNPKLPPIKPLPPADARAPIPQNNPFPRPTFASQPAGKPVPAIPNHRLPSATVQPKVELSSSVSQVAIPAAEISKLSDEITVLKNEITALKSEITARDNRITMLQSQCDALTSRCQNSEGLVESLTAENAQLSEQLQAYASHTQNQSDRMQQIAREIMEIANRV